MTDREFFIETMNDEFPRFMRVFQALPENNLDYKHPDDPKARTPKELAVMMAVEISTFREFLSTGVIDFAAAHQNAPSGLPEGITAFEKNFKDSVEQATQMSESEWDSPAKMLSGKKVEWETTRGKMAWALLLDAIHHRGQLSTMIRPMGGKVPNIYGPSGDSAE